VWPEADGDPVNNDWWIETGPIYEDLDDFPEGLIPPGFVLNGPATLDTGVFYNAPFTQEGVNEAFIANAHGDQLAYMFANHSLSPAVGSRQLLDATYTSGLTYQLTAGLGKSFYLPPDLYDPNSTMAIRLLYEDGLGDWQVAAETSVLASDLSSVLLTDTDVLWEATELADGARIGIEFVPLHGVGGVWTLDNVRLSVIPEPATGAMLLLGACAIVRRRRSL